MAERVHSNHSAPESPKAGNSLSRDGATISTNADALTMFFSMLQRFGFPAGMFPLQSIEEFGFVEQNGVWWLKQKEKVEHKFAMVKHNAVYMKEISGQIAKGRIQNLEGFKMKPVMDTKLFLAQSAKVIWLDDPPSDKIHFKPARGPVETFPIDAFAAGQ